MMTDTQVDDQAKEKQRRDSKCDADMSSDASLGPELSKEDQAAVVKPVSVGQGTDESKNSLEKEAIVAQSVGATETELNVTEEKTEPVAEHAESLLAVDEIDSSSQVSVNTFATADGDISDNIEGDINTKTAPENNTQQMSIEEDETKHADINGEVVDTEKPQQISIEESKIEDKTKGIPDDEHDNGDTHVDVAKSESEVAEVMSTTVLEVENLTSSPPRIPERNYVNSQVNQVATEDNSAVGMFRRFTSTFSLRNARGTFGSRESLRNVATQPTVGNRDSTKSSLSDDSNNSDQSVVTPNGLYARDIPDSFSMLDDTSSIRSSITVDLLVSRVEAQNKVFDPKATVAHLRSGSISRLKGLIDEEAEANIDWEFWGNLISDYPGMVRKNSRLVSKNIQNGIPASLRGSIWQLISKSKDPPLEILYTQLLEQTSSFDKMITRDLSRTFPNHEFFQNNGVGQESLYNVVKGFSLYDTDVGYCQGIPFIVGPLLLHMPEEEAFCVLVRLMRAYGLRGHFTPQMETLHLRLYQFDHLLEEYLPALNKHMVAETITSSMYASQWFMTLFAYRFPLPLVFRIFDIIFAEGVESLLRFAIALLKANQEKLLEMPFETLLDFLKHHLYEIYEGRINQLISDAYDVKITTKRLDRLSRDYYADLKKQQAEVNLVESLKGNNKRLEEDVKRLENNVQTLNEEHCELANEFVQCKLDIAHLQDENETLKFEVTQLKEQLEQSRREAEQAVKEEMELLAHKNFELADRNTRLEDQLSELEAQLIETKMRYAESENERVQLQKKWDDLRRAFH
ncbi:TBC-domain-containing protein [Basidiobolus meristosporus CBS 931.73]|uniref:TBC-domain-containing protein n=1 Tax=Basidiobolus meristosporus CBS 931.73 TaxID=1314790 RepID=A0A1Y1XRU3_9FUNG|nr:TBC-domain-containing protein [Basidiobolus meristosporus CBS 931.73]|eukprot:ORX88385.1 TBC-domain-containing protein [Basidiobolus meristosporus CBS 931.73]